MKKDSRIYIAGHTGLAGSAIVRELKTRGYDNLILRPRYEVDVKYPFDIDRLFTGVKPEYVFIAAAHAGGIKEAIENPVGMLVDNLYIQTNLIRYAHMHDVKKLMFLGSSCMYPVDAPQPYKEEDLGNGKTDENWSYAVAKLAGLELCRAFHRQHGRNFITAIPCNLYGPGDNFDLEKAHVIPALIRKLNNGKNVTVWGDGLRWREFLYVDDFARATVDLMEGADYEDLCNGAVNIGAGQDVSILKLVDIIRDIIGFKGKISFAPGKYPGVKTKLLDISRISNLDRFGWKPRIPLEEGIKRTYEWYQNSTYCQSG